MRATQGRSLRTLVRALRRLVVPVERWELQGVVSTVDAGPPRNFGFGFGLSKAAASGPVHVLGWRALLSITDPRAGQCRAEERLVAPPWSASVASPTGLRIGAAQTLERAEDWRLGGAAGAWALRARLEDGRGVDLDLRSGSAPHSLSALLGNNGRWDAEPRLEAEGTLFDGVRLRRVAGSAWCDHRSNDSAKHPPGVSKVVRIQLETGPSLLAVCFRTPAASHGAATLVSMGGSGSGNDSAVSGSRADWEDLGEKVQGVGGCFVPGTRLWSNTFDLEVSPLAPDLEGGTHTRPQALPACRHGVCTVRGIHNGQPVGGWAFVEAHDRA